ncbi:MAG: helix-hairpin-helix domain-containing protein, partial [Bacilli bacterium]|nr:helix-hairpin-helix domain-containing protein [Bacilli bacterium]
RTPRSTRVISSASSVVYNRNRITYKYFERPVSNTENISNIALLEKNITDEEKEPIEENSTETDNTIYVDIKGAVKKPGVYKVEPTSIINDVISLAGGFSSSAYKNNINLSKKVSPEMVIYVYTKSEINSQKVTCSNASSDSSVSNSNNNSNSTIKTPNIAEETSTTCKTPSYNISDCLDDKTSIIEDNSSKTPENSENTEKKPDTSTSNNNSPTLININLADVSALTSVSGIGESKAKAIISYREQNGNFACIDEIMNVSGIGSALFEKIKNNITV